MEIETRSYGYQILARCLQITLLAIQEFNKNSMIKFIPETCVVTIDVKKMALDLSVKVCYGGDEQNEKSLTIDDIDLLTFDLRPFMDTELRKSGIPLKFGRFLDPNVQ